MTKEATTKKATKSTLLIVEEVRWSGHRGPCDSKKHCPGMRAALKADTGKTGMHVSVLFNSNTMSTRAVVTYSLGQKQSLMVNYCPWCGTKLAKDEEAAPVAHSDASTTTGS